MSKKSHLEKVTNQIALSGLLTGVAIGMLGYNTIGRYTEKIIPSTNQVEEGYVVPSNLGITLQDFDGNGKKDVVMNYDGQSYLLKLDDQGKPQVKNYKIKVNE
jgi:hemin uptake protein HemP